MRMNALGCCAGFEKRCWGPAPTSYSYLRRDGTVCARPKLGLPSSYEWWATLKLLPWAARRRASLRGRDADSYPSTTEEVPACNGPLLILLHFGTCGCDMGHACQEGTVS